MKYILDSRYRLRGWYKLPGGLYDNWKKEAVFPENNAYLLLLKCDGAHEIDPETLGEEEKKILEGLEKERVIRPARFWELLKPEQMYKQYPARYREEAHWSVTGACNLKCRHCFMSAPHARHGSPSHEEIINVADQLAECGVCRVGITGGEPLIREDFLEIIDAMLEREIGISTLYTNGWLVDEKLLDEFEKRDLYCGFQLSYDGVGCHDFLRGVPGAEERTLNAIRLLQERKFPVSVAMCVHRKNKHTIRESVNLMASMGVRSIKLGSMMQLGEWAKPEVLDLQMTPAEEQELFEEYIPQYFEDNAPLSIMMHGSFMYTPGDKTWGIYNERKITEEESKHALACGVLGKNFYIGADGMVAPCMGMCDCGYASHFPNLKETPLREILQESDLVKLCYSTVSDVRNGNDECRKCEYIDRCTGGCRNAALCAGDNYFGVDPDACTFFKNGWDKRIREIAQPAFEAYLKRCPPKETEEESSGKEQAQEICP